MKNKFIIVLYVISMMCLLSSSAILWYVMILSACKLTVMGILLFIVGCTCMYHFSKLTGVKML